MVKKEKKDIYKYIDVSLIDAPSEVARLEIPEDQIKELAQSIREQGLLQPILVFRKDGRYEVVAGHRRYLAHKYLKEKTISCKIVDTSTQMNALARASENLQRSDLSPLEEGLIYIGLVKTFDMPLDQIAKITGVSAGVVKRRIDIIKMPDSLKDAVHKKKISQTVAEELMDCKDEAYREYLIEMAREHGVTKEVARNWVNDHKKELRAGSSAGGEGSPVSVSEKREPVYVTCFLCKGAVEVMETETITVCRGCKKQLIEILNKEAQ